jgi:hypothetical protein
MILIWNLRMIYLEMMIVFRVLCDKGSEDWGRLYKFSTSQPGLNHTLVLPISEDSSSFDCFQLIFTDKLFNIILVETNHCCQQCIQEEENKTQNSDVTFDKIYCFRAVIIMVDQDGWYSIRNYGSTKSYVILHFTHE